MLAVETQYHLQQIKEWFDALHEAGESVETLDRKQVNEYHEFALQTLLRYVWNHNPYYKNRLEQAGYEVEAPFDAEAFSRLSFLTKDDIREDYKSILTKQKLAHICKSTGTTGGKPTYIGHTVDELYSYYFAPKYPSLMGMVKNSTVANALPYEMSSSALTFHHEFQHLLGCTILPVGKGGAYSDPELALRFMIDWDADVIVTTPSYAIVLYEMAAACGIDVRQDLGIKHMFLTGEGTSNHFRKRIEELWGCRSTILFGSLEAMLVGIECEAQDGFHLADGHLYIEIVDPDTGETLESGQQGEIVITTLLREGMPLIRYRSGDIGFIDESPCSCGISIPKLYLRGRVADQIRLGGESYSPFYLEDIVMRARETGNWYRFIVKDDALSVEVEPRDANTDREELVREIESLLEFHLNMECAVAVVDAVPRNPGKIKRVWFE